jgi:L-seryl-tRNA(Ser) seleniumtransferase
MNRFLYSDWGLKPAINAHAYMTPIGGSIMPPEVVQAMADAAPYFIDVHALNAKAGSIIAQYTGADGGLVTSGAMGGMLLQAAACMTGTDLAKVRRLPDTTGMRNEILYFHSQRVTYFRAFQIAGARLVPIGEDARGADTWELENTISDKTAAVAYVFGPGIRCSLSLREVVEVAHRHDVPVIVDAAAMLPPAENLKKYIAEGADMVAFSGGKGIRGPQSTGILCGRKDLMEAAVLNSSPNYRCIGRPMKVSKEEIVGLITVLELFVNQDHEATWADWKDKAKHIVDRLRDVPGLKVFLDEDPTTREGPVAVVQADQSWKGVRLRQVPGELMEGDPPILVGFHVSGFAEYLDELVICTTNLRDDEHERVAQKVRSVLTKSQVSPRNVEG